VGNAGATGAAAHVRPGRVGYAADVTQLRVTVRLSGELARRLGSRRVIELASGALVDDLVAALAGEAGVDPKVGGGLAVVSNGSFVPRDRPLANGDELDVLVPVAGG
jgi:molybdopterin converting factor small subunit